MWEHQNEEVYPLKTTRHEPESVNTVMKCCDSERKEKEGAAGNQEEFGTGMEEKEGAVGAQGEVGMDDKEKEEAMRFLGRKVVTEGTAASYAAGVKHWDYYLHGMEGQSGYPGRTLERAGGKEDRILRMVHFAQHLYEVKGMRAEQVAKVFTAVRHLVRANGGSVDWMKDSLLQDAKRACRRSTSELREMQERKKGTAFLPAFIAMMKAIRDNYWVDLPRGKGTKERADAMDKRAIWLACACTFGDGTRISQWARPDGKKAQDHTIRSEHCYFEIQHPKGGRVWRVSAHSLVGFVEGNQVENEDVLSMVITYVSSKTTDAATKQKVPVVLYWGKRSEPERQVLEDMVTFLRSSGVKKGDHLLRRYEGTKMAGRTTNRKDCSEAVKHGASLFGLPAQRFSAKSLRSGMASLANQKAETAGENGREAVRERGGWTGKSRVPEKHYVFPAKTKGGFAIVQAWEGEEQYGGEDVQRLMEVDM